jgi:muconate cycloisomerase
MQLEKVTLYRIRIPFKQSFKHANAARNEADNLIVRCQLSNGVVGWGETIARDYVTGETSEGTFDRLALIPRAVWAEELSSALDIVAFHQRAGLSDANVARCGVELALLDAFARTRAQPLYQLLAEEWPALAKIRNESWVRYGGPFGLGSLSATVLTAAKLRAFGFGDVKLKLGTDRKLDAKRVRLARAILGEKVDLRVDANEAWTLDHALAMAPILTECRVSAVEQPFSKALDANNVAFAKSTGLPIIADESLCSLDAARRLLACDIDLLFAVKIAKLGGFLSTLQVLQLAEQKHVGIQIGCQVGESAILSAAGRHLAVLCPNLRYLEGSHDRFLLARNVARQDITFGWGGVAPTLKGPGLGVDVEIDRVERCAVNKLELFSRSLRRAPERSELPGMLS